MCVWRKKMEEQEVLRTGQEGRMRNSVGQDVG
jgi:hypothetical protein